MATRGIANVVDARVAPNASEVESSDRKRPFMSRRAGLRPQKEVHAAVKLCSSLGPGNLPGAWINITGFSEILQGRIFRGHSPAHPHAERRRSIAGDQPVLGPLGPLERGGRRCHPQTLFGVLLRMTALESAPFPIVIEIVVVIVVDARVSVLRTFPPFPCDPRAYAPGYYLPALAVFEESMHCVRRSIDRP
jgi:hypothetical protein